MEIRNTDISIIEQLAADPEAGFRSLIAKYMQPVYWHVRRLVIDHDDAEDVVQETFMRVFRSASRLSPELSLKAWIYRIATNEALRHIDRRPPPSDSLSARDATDVAADEFIDYTDIEALRLQQAIHTLPPRQQAVFNLRYFDNLSYEDIARILESSPATLKSNYHVAKQKIIKYLTQ